jgi:hypothetical protein
MARGARYDTQLRCPLCGKRGVATWEEHEALPEHGWLREKKLIFLTKGFRAGIGSVPTVYCDTCNIAVSN